jgi:two-component system response regulator FixJ
MSSEPIVFIVDDNPAVLDSASFLLETIGLNVQSFPSAETFLEAYQPSQSGCLLVDVRLPGMSGLELAAKLTADGIDLPVILISGHVDIKTTERCAAVGSSVLLEKPIESHDLIDHVRNAISLSEAPPVYRPQPS